jgi:hypothetical protein
VLPTEGLFTEVPRRGVLGSSDQIEEEHDRSERDRSGNHLQQLPGGAVLGFLVWWASPTPSAPVSHFPSLLASALGGAPDVDRTCQGYSEGKGLSVFVLDDNDSVQGSDLPDFQ